ncbi:Calcium/calmodulin-dependent 3',5'-cyclic nucleotide phosphodiesterase 1C [Channa argus]|uniref:Calcium/calmodulin-dependent 3',5'-cyclic nucleotide phosphodiesterase 1C n=1 Tax=Channa argus TaxID=215402 RepID=A0A6G1QM98_CHAAH|nr:Calcium/calmodulin-dependent 3',5'-cyclic nucleotide phosphodiesterase 1C [Channa argus]
MTAESSAASPVSSGTASTARVTATEGGAATGFTPHRGNGASLSPLSSTDRQRAEECTSSATMTEAASKKQGFKKCRSATFSIDGFSFTIGSQSQNVLCTTVTASVDVTDHKGIVVDPRTPDEILADELPTPDAPDVLERTAIRRLAEPEDELKDIQSDTVPSEVRDWLASTFTRQRVMMLRRSEDKPRFRAIVHAVQAGIFVERIYRRTSNMAGLSYPPNVIATLKNMNMWSFDVFALNDASGDHALKFVFYELLTRYDLINRFKVPVSALISFLDSLEVGYTKYKNPYHNLMHAADVTQTIHYLLVKTGMVKSIQQLLRHANLIPCFRELRTLVVEMVLATDMSCHFQQVKAMKSLLQQPEEIDKPKALSLLLHTADISHPAKRWELHHRWTSSLLEEFFQQGDKEAELGLPFSPLCDRKSTMVAQSQIGFIDFIVDPTFTVMTEMIEKIVTPLIEEASRSGLAGIRRSSLNSICGSDGKHSSVKSTGSEGSCCLTTVDIKSFSVTWNQEIHHNRELWKAQADKDLNDTAKTETNEEKKVVRTVDKVTTGEEEMKTDVEHQKEKEHKRQREKRQPKEEEGDNNPREAAGSLQRLHHHDTDKKNPDSHTEKQQRQHQNADRRPDYPLINYCKRPSYCAGYYRLVRSKVTEMRPIDARGKARRLQRISLRRRKVTL